MAESTLINSRENNQKQIKIHLNLLTYNVIIFVCNCRRCLLWRLIDAFGRNFLGWFTLSVSVPLSYSFCVRYWLGWNTHTHTHPAEVNSGLDEAWLQINSHTVQQCGTCLQGCLFVCYLHTSGAPSLRSLSSSLDQCCSLSDRRGQLWMACFQTVTNNSC